MSKDLKDYIVKLNDRNIQRQRETGFTLYAIFGAIIYCIHFLIDNLSAILLIKKDANYLIIATITSDILFIFFILNLAFQTKTRKKRITKIFPYQTPIKIEYRDLPVFATFCLIGYLNFQCLQFSELKLFSFFLWVFGMITSLNLLTPFIAGLVGYIIRQRKKRKGNSVEKMDFTMFNEKSINGFSLSFLIYSFLLLTLTFFTLSNIHLSFATTLLPMVVKYTLTMYGLLYLLKVEINIISKKNINRELEEFEKEIFFENMSNEDIAKKFEHEFDGIPFSKWLNNKQIEILEFFEIKKQEFTSLDSTIITLDNIDRNIMIYEYDGRLENIINKQTNILKETSNFVLKTANTFKNLRNFGSLNENEFIQLNYVQSLLQNNISIFNASFQNILSKIEDKQKKAQSKQLLSEK